MYSYKKSLLIKIWIWYMIRFGNLEEILLKKCVGRIFVCFILWSIQINSLHFLTRKVGYVSTWISLSEADSGEGPHLDTLDDKSLLVCHGLPSSVPHSFPLLWLLYYYRITLNIGFLFSFLPTQNWRLPCLKAGFAEEGMADRGAYSLLTLCVVGDFM